MLTVGNEAITDWVRLVTQGLMEDTELRQALKRMGLCSLLPKTAPR